MCHCAGGQGSAPPRRAAARVLPSAADAAPSRKRKATEGDVAAALRDAAPPRARKQHDDLSGDEEEEGEG